MGYRQYTMTCFLNSGAHRLPHRLRNGYDLVIQALEGMMHITGTEETPCKTGVALIDIITGLYAQNAI